MWLLESETRQRLEHVNASGIVPTAEQQIEFEARIGGDSSNSPRILKMAGSTAEISISGVLTKAPDFMAYYFGGGNTTYADIMASIAIAESDKDVTDIVFAIDSPGGNVNGLFDAVAAINGATKPTKAVVTGQAASAAYALAAQADEITATQKSSALGSIGIVARMAVDENQVSITSTNAPNKAPDPTTEEGKAIIRTQLDAYEDLFIDAIAEGRGTTAKDVRKNFGQGGVYLAEEALNRGMIDGIAGQTATAKVPKNKTAANARGANIDEAKSMDKQTLMAQHPELYAAVLAEGETKERDRVDGHLTMGVSSGDTETAYGAIRDGSVMTATLQAKYMSAAMNKSAIEARGADDKDADPGKLAPDADTEALAGKSILTAAAELCGVELEM